MAVGTDKSLRHQLLSLLTARALRAVVWGVWLFASILIAGLWLYPALSGRILLGLIAAGAVLFAMARSTVAPMHKGPGSCEGLLSAPARVVYWCGYGLMLTGTTMTTLVALGLVGR